MNGTQQLVGFLANSSPVALFAIFIVALLRRWLVLPRELDARDARIRELEDERDEFKDLAFRALNIGERMTEQREGRARP